MLSIDAGLATSDPSLGQAPFEFAQSGFSGSRFGISHGEDYLIAGVKESRNVPFVDLDTTAIARSLSQIADREGDLADAYFERREEVELPADDDPPGIRVWRDEGFAIRLLRGGNTWLATRDQIDRSLFAESLRQVARVMPAAPYPQPALRIGAFPPTDIPRQLLRFPQSITREIRRRLAGFPMRLQVRLHRRWVRVVGTQLAPEQQEEEFFSLQADMPWGQYGALLPQLDPQATEGVASSLMLLFKGRERRWRWRQGTGLWSWDRQRVLSSCTRSWHMR